MVLEVVVYSIESAMNAQLGGADRIELCDNMAEGGTTPSLGVIEIVRQALSIDVYVMIRPRGGDFVYSSYEYQAMKRDIEMCKRASVDGVVVGILNPNGTLDKIRCKNLIEAARPMKVTCHRAFDVSADSFAMLEDCIEVGFDRILTSGRKATAPEGASLIKELVVQSNGRIPIMAGSGVNEYNAEALIKATSVKEIHLSAGAMKEPVHSDYNKSVNFNSCIPSDYLVSRVADVDKIKRTRALLGSFST